MDWLLKNLFAIFLIFLGVVLFMKMKVEDGKGVFKFFLLYLLIAVSIVLFADFICWRLST